MLSRQSVLVTALLVALVGGTNYLALKNSESKLQQAPEGLHITGIGTKIHVTQMTVSGTLDYTGSADKMIKYSDGKSRLFQIQFINYTKDQTPPWQLTADNGWSYPNNSQIDLWDHVHIWKEASKTSHPLDFTSAQLTYYPAQDFATTDVFVQFTEPDTHNITTGVGMRAHPKAEKIQLLSKVNSTYEAPAPSSPKTIINTSSTATP